MDEAVRVEELDAEIAEMLGVALHEESGVLHTAAVWRRPGTGELVVLRIGEHSPKSGRDLLLLCLGRARAQAIVTTGRILREEPGLDFDLSPAEGAPGGDGPAAEVIEEWRRSRCGLEAPARIVVLSSGRDLPLHHPALEGQDAVVFTSLEGLERLERKAGAFGVQVVGREEPDVRGAVSWLRDQGLDRVTIEAGPATALQLYRDENMVDGLCLSTYQGSELAEAARGPQFLTGDELHRLLQPVEEATTFEEASGPWSFQYWRRRHA